MKIKKNEYSLKDISSQNFKDRFIPSKKRTPNFGFKKYPVWAKFDIKNISNSHLDLFIKHNNANIHYINFHYRINGTKKFHTIETGILKNIRTRDYQHAFFLFDIKIPANKSIECYMQISSQATLNFDLAILNKKSLMKFSSKRFF